MAIILDLFFSFAKIGLFTFGGGYAMIFVIEDLCVEKRKWITHDEMMNVTVIAESTPGPISINCATFVGYKRAGLPGAIAASIGVVLPSFIIIYVISRFLDNFLEIQVIANAFKGIKCAVGVLIVNAAVNMFRKMKKTIFSCSIIIASFAAMMIINVFSWNFSSIGLMLIAAFVSILATAICGNKQKGGN